MNKNTNKNMNASVNRTVFKIIQKAALFMSTDNVE